MAATKNARVYIGERLIGEATDCTLEFASKLTAEEANRLDLEQAKAIDGEAPFQAWRPVAESLRTCTPKAAPAEWCRCGLDLFGRDCPWCNRITRGEYDRERLSEIARTIGARQARRFRVFVGSSFREGTELIGECMRGVWHVVQTPAAIMVHSDHAVRVRRLEAWLNGEAYPARAGRSFPLCAWRDAAPPVKLPSLTGGIAGGLGISDLSVSKPACPCGGEAVDVRPRAEWAKAHGDGDWLCVRCGRAFGYAWGTRGGWTCSAVSIARDGQGCALLHGHRGEHQTHSRVAWRDIRAGEVVTEADVMPAERCGAGNAAGASCTHAGGHGHHGAHVYPPAPKVAPEDVVRGLLLVAGIDLERVTFAQEYPAGDFPVDAEGRSPEAVAASVRVVTVRGDIPADLLAALVIMGWAVHPEPVTCSGFVGSLPEQSAAARADYLEQKRRRFCASRGWKA